MNLPANIMASSTERTILVVEDEAGLRDLIEEILGAAGYTVLMAQDGANAMRLSEEYPSQIDLLLTDLTLPGMAGQEIACRLSAIRPQMEILFMSGRPPVENVGPGLPRAHADFIQKPWTPRGLRAKIDVLLNPRAAALRILVVDDDEGMREWLTDILKAKGYQIFTARDGLEAKRIAGRVMIDLLITDISMPDEDGLGTICALTKAYPALKMIAMSGVNPEALVDAKLLGAHATLTKPFTSEMMLQTIRDLSAIQQPG
jgi:DNA-binding response OmpR family regulator